MTLVKRRRGLFDWPDLFDMPRMGGLAENERIRVEEFRSDGEYVIRAEIPGVDAEQDIDVTVKDGALHISAERTMKKSGGDDDVVWSEFRYGSFSRSLRLPEGVSEADISANYENGILEVRLPAPASETAEAKKIPVKTGG